eukprot:Partr_v1_DN28910_c0_g1_i1_m25417 putative DyNactin
MEAKLIVGAVVEFQGLQGTVRFVGSTSFATGNWVGIELPDATGKNDGSVQGQRYFTCAPNHGVFVRFSQVKNVISSPSAVVSEDVPLASNERPPLGIVVPNAEVEVIESSRRQSMAPPPLSASSSSDPRRISTANQQMNKTVPLKEFEELRMRMKLLEAKRVEDKDKLRDLERLKSDNEQLSQFKSRQASKLHELQGEVMALRKTVKDSAQAHADLDSKYRECCDSLEMLALDKEMAEERAETLQLEVEAMKEQIEELSLNLEVLQEEQGIDESKPIRAAGSNDDAQLEKQNERLREALVKLRDVTTTRENEMERKIKNLERQQLKLDEVNAANQEFKEKISQAEDTIEHLKMQLDDALENNSLIELLTDKNLRLSELAEKNREEIQDLEALRDLNDELEENHIETERELMEEIENRDRKIRALGDEITAMAENNADYEGTILKFRDLVKNLQSDIESLKGAQNQDKRQILSSQSREMLKLNMELQNTAMKNTSKAIELDLRKMEVQQARDELRIVSLYCPEAFYEVDKCCLNTYFCLSRIAFKSDLIVNYLEEKMKRTMSAEASFSISLIQQQGANIYSTSFSAVQLIKNCNLDEYARLQHHLDDLLFAESKLDASMALLKKEELTDESHLIDVERILAQLIAFRDSAFKSRPLSISTGAMEAHARALDVCAETLRRVSSTFDSINFGTSAADGLIRSAHTGICDEAEKVLVGVRMNCRSIERTFSDASAGSMVKIGIFQELEAVRTALESIVFFYRMVSKNLRAYFAAAGTDIVDADYQEVISSIAKEFFGSTSGHLFVGVKSQLVKVSEMINGLYKSVLDDANYMPLSKAAEPWTLRSAAMLNARQADPEAELKLSTMTDEIQALKQQISTKEENYNQSHMKVQILEKRIEALREQSSVVDHYEVEIKKLKEQETFYMDAIETMQVDIDKLRTELQVKSRAPSPNQQTLDTAISDKRVAALYSAMHIIQEENAYLKSSHSRSITKSLLNAPLARPHQKSAAATESDGLRRNIILETKSIARDLLSAAANTRVVDLTLQESKTTHKWAPMSTRPEHQYHSQQAVMHTLQRRREALQQKIDHWKMMDTQKTTILSQATDKDRKLKLVARVNATLGKSASTCRKIVISTREEFEHIHRALISSE